MTDLRFFDCGQCGHIGSIEKLKDHPTRPMPCDMGFCPECGTEVDEHVSEARVRELLAEYGEDAEAFFSGLQVAA